jgi:hypothetical protein
VGVVSRCDAGHISLLPGFRPLEHQGIMWRGNHLQDGQHAKRHRKDNDQPDTCHESAPWVDAISNVTPWQIVMIEALVV